jgi:uncharacterized protein YndB with AHSA1/START domain
VPLSQKQLQQQNFTIILGKRLQPHVFLVFYVQPFSYTSGAKDMEKLAVERSALIEAPRERVWQAITDPGQIVKWFVPNLPFASMTRDESGKVTIHLGEMGINLLILETTDPPRQASMRSLPERLLASTYTLEENKNGTQVTVTMTGFEALPENARHDRLNQSGAGWAETLENLKAYVSGKELPFPQAVVGPLFGFWREPSEKLAIERSIWINAPRERVWRAITDPEQIRQWFSPGSTFKSTGTEVGARLYIENPETGAEMYVQTLEVVEAPHRLITRSVPEATEPAYDTAWTLTEENGGTRLTLTYSGYELEPVDTRWRNMEENAFGFGMMLQNVKAVVEGESLPVPGGF